MTAPALTPLVSPARAASELGCPLWVLELLVDRGVLSAHRVNGQRKIRGHELNGLRRRRDPTFRDPRYGEETT